jgi:FtsZ-binding cell division protein ZapB
MNIKRFFLQWLVSAVKPDKVRKSKDDYIKELETEIEQLNIKAKIESEDFIRETVYAAEQSNKIEEENENLKAEVERLQEVIKSYAKGAGNDYIKELKNDDELLLLKGENQYLKGKIEVLETLVFIREHNSNNV